MAEAKQVDARLDPRAAVTVVPIGDSCCIAYQLRAMKLREHALPFDWSRISLAQVVKCLKNDFKGFLDIATHRMSETHPHLESFGPSVLMTNAEGVRFAHQLQSPREIPDWIDRMEKRITAFQAVQRPLFVRIELKPLKLSYFKTLRDFLDFMCRRFDCEARGAFLLLFVEEASFHSRKPQFEALREEFPGVHVAPYAGFSADWTMKHVNWVKIKELVMLDELSNDEI